MGLFSIRGQSSDTDNAFWQKCPSVGEFPPTRSKSTMLRNNALLWRDAEDEWLYVTIRIKNKCDDGNALLGFIFVFKAIEILQVTYCVRFVKDELIGMLFLGIVMWFLTDINLFMVDGDCYDALVVWMSSERLERFVKELYTETI